MSTAKKKAESGGFNPLSRDNIEALTMAIIMAVMLKYFIVEAYKIPTGSMQPTLLGNEDTGIYDRIIVDKLSYHVRDPERWEVAVFKYPLDRSKNFIKRICGMPGENFLVRDGDLWTRPDDTSELKILRRPRPVQMEVWKRINPADPRYQAWKPNDGTRTWSVQGRARVEARGDGAVHLPSDGGSVVDMYGDGYPDNMGSMLSAAGRVSPSNSVADLRITGDVKALAGCKQVTVELREGMRSYQFVIPGPAAAEDARVRIEAPLGAVPGSASRTAAGSEPWKLRAGKSVSFAAQNMDDVLQLEVDGDIVATLEILRSDDQSSSFTLRAEGEGADFDDVEIYRDIFYTPGTSPREFKIPPGNYVMLGDNTQDSSDSREWNLATFSWDGDGSNGQVVRGNSYVNQNPIRRVGGPEGARIFFRDEWGELHDFIEKRGDQGPLIRAPYVPRNLITGRAVVVFWPLTWLWPPNWGDNKVPTVTRLQWVH